MKKEISESEIILVGTFFKATTTIDGGWRVSFDVDTSQGPEMVKLSELQGELLKILVLPGNHHLD